ncbi:hypothetical protein DdX_12224 [Ditylenchus destructor]|uniref:Uncharacterized protein n=1 Tax=Ditylenchus destructor TaxID=166010 RepID=A0AAD4N0X0_9BILA|nr:hypothetical protein DdX_12224 [Ditylenchus destructor]
MLNGLYGFIFGSQDKVVGEEVKQGNGAQAGKTKKDEAGDWILVSEDSVEKSQPNNALIDECQSISSSAPSMTASWSETESGNVANKKGNGKKVDEEKKQQKIAIAASLQQRQWLTQMLFSDPGTASGKAAQSIPMAVEPVVVDAKLQTPSENRLKKANKAEHVQTQAKSKPRSKKQGPKSSANRNNDRKCNNIA